VSDQYLWDKSGEPDPDIVALEEALAPLKHKEQGYQTEPKRTAIAQPAQRLWPRVVLALAAALALGVVGLVTLRPAPRVAEIDSTPLPTAPDLPSAAASNAVPSAPQSWSVTRIAGAPTVSDQSLSATGNLQVGQWLETDSNSQAEILVAEIGQVDVAPDSRVRLSATGPSEHRLELARGRIDAKVTAPPRIFQVLTPSATAVDLGCAYSLEVDDKGAAVLDVKLGYVSLEWDKKVSLVPAGARCRTKPGSGPGTPFFEDASLALKTAVAHFDFGDATEAGRAVSTILSSARKRDSLTLWHLLNRVDKPQRKAVYDRLRQFVTPPSGVTEAAAVALDQETLGPWEEQMRATW
jgi:hypothetical protein